MSTSSESISRRRATGLNLFFQYASVGLTVVQGFVLVPFYLAHIDAATFGAWLATGSVVAWLGTIDPGLSAVLQQRVARRLGEGAVGALATTIGTGVLVATGIAGLFAAAGLAVAPMVAGLAGIDSASAPLISRAFALSCVAEAILLLDLALAAILMGLMARIAWTGTIYLLCTVLGVTVTVLLLGGGYGLLSIPLGLLIRSLMLLLSHGVLTLWVLRHDLRVRPRLSRLELRSVMGISLFTWTARLAGSVVGNMDALLVAQFFGPAAVTSYVLTKRASEVLGMVVSRVGAAFSPALAHAWGSGGASGVVGVSSRLLRLALWVSGIGAAGFVGLNREFVALWVGPNLFGGPLLTVCLGLAAAALAWESIATTILFAADGARASSGVTALSAVARAGLALLLLMSGAGTWALPLAALVVSGMLSAGFTMRRLSTTIARGAPSFVRDLRRSVLESTALIPIGLAWSWALGPLSGTGWVAFSVGALSLGSSSCLALGALSPAFRSELAALRRMGSKRSSAATR